MGEIVLYGNATITGEDAAPGTIFQASNVIDLTPVKKIAVLCKLKSGATLNQTNYIFSFGAAYNGGNNNFRIHTNTLGQLRVGSRTSTNNALSVTAATVSELTQAASYVNVTDLVAQTSKNFRNGTLVEPEFTGVGTAWNFPRSLSPTIMGFGTDGLDWSFYEAHIWLADEDDPFPTDVDWVAFNSGTPASGLSVPPSHSWIPAGTNGAVVTQILDTGSVGGLHLYKTQGPTSGARAPIFLGATSQELNAGALTVTSRTVTLNYTNNENGTIYFIVGPASANASNPSAAQIKAGNNQNGTAASFTANAVVSTTGAKTQQFTSLTPSQSLRGFAVIEKSAGVFTNVVSWDFVTPRIGIELPEIYAPTNPRTRWENQTGINVEFSSAGVSDYNIANGATDASGRATFDLSSAPGWNLPEGTSVKVTLTKGNYSFSHAYPLVNLDT